MIRWEPWHRLEYQRERAKGKCVHAYTEIVEDTGWRKWPRGYTRERWFVTYTRCCAEEFLERQHAEPGVYVVAVYRTGDTPGGDGTLMGSIRLPWPTRSLSRRDDHAEHPVASSG